MTQCPKIQQLAIRGHQSSAKVTCRGYDNSISRIKVKITRKAGAGDCYFYREWVTTQPHWEERLAQHSQTLPFSLSPPSDSQQRQFLTDYCRAQQPLDSTPVTVVEKQAEVLLQRLGQSDLSTENLLHLQILAELFSDSFRVNPSFTETEFKPFNRLDLYEKSIKNKYKVFYDKKMKREPSKLTLIITIFPLRKTISD